MQHFVSTRTASFATALALSTLLTSDEIAFQPKQNAEVAKELEIELEGRLASLQLKLNGEEIPPEALGDLGDRSVAVKMLVGVTEKYVDTKEGRPIDLLRTYDEMSLSGEFGEEKEDVGEFAKLVGKTVRFKWNDADAEYDKSFHESEGDVADLEQTWDDMDLRVLLPERKPSQGDTWEVVGEKLGPLFLPGGVVGKSDDEDAAEFEQFREMLAAELDAFLKEFKVVCKYQGTREADGVSVREIAFQFDGSAKLDLSELTSGLIEMQDEAPEMDVQSDVTLQVNGDGVLLWNQAAGHMHSFDMRSEVALDVDVEMRIDQDGQNFDMSLTGRAEGKVTWEMDLKKPQ